MHARPRRRALLAGVALAVALAAATGLVSASPAWAHAELLASQPDDGATVSEELATLRLEFDEPVDVRLLAVVDLEGNDLARAEPDVADTVVEQPLAEPAHTGSYTVAYRILSADGHAVEGELTFTYTGPTTDDVDAPAAEPDPPGPAGWWLLAAVATGVLVVTGAAIASWRALSHRPRSAGRNRGH